MKNELGMGQYFTLTINTGMNVENVFHRENRYMLFLTENYAALDILKNPKNYLSDKLRIDEEQGLSLEVGKDVQPFILFGSSFPKDKEYTQV